MNKISVIIPIYNVEQFLPLCLESVINQTYQNLEIILVNDGSTDSCPQICNDYASRDSLIKVVHQKNGGLSAARNAGLQIATGEFISFVDSDDLLSLDFYHILLNTLLENDADIVECEFQKFVNENQIICSKKESENLMHVFEGEKIIEALFKGPLHVMVWNKIYKLKLVRGMLFPLNRISEDVFWTYKVYGEATKTVKIDKELYFYRHRENSIMATKYSIKRLDSLDAYEEKIDYLKEKFPNLVEDVRKAYCFLLIDNYIQLKRNHEIDPDKFHRNIILEKIMNYNHFTEFKKWEWKDLVWYKLFILTPSIYMKVKGLNEKRIKTFNKSYADSEA